MTIGVFDALKYEAMVNKRNALNKQIHDMEQEHIRHYQKERPADHVHDEKCQSRKSWGGNVCTCEINRTLRREAILAAGAANDTIVLDSLGSIERMTWNEGRALENAKVQAETKKA